MKDIEPYICLFPDCDDESAIFRSSDDFLNHMRQHTTVWSCQIPGHESEAFSSPVELESHVRSAHAGSVTESQILLLVESSARPHPDTLAVLAAAFDRPDGKDTSESPSARCLLCEKLAPAAADGESNLFDHVLEHLEDLALLSLPPSENQEHGQLTTSGKKSAGTAQDMSDLPELHFSDDAQPPDAPGQSAISLFSWNAEGLPGDPGLDGLLNWHTEFSIGSQFVDSRAARVGDDPAHTVSRPPIATRSPEGPVEGTESGRDDSRNLPDELEDIKAETQFMLIAEKKLGIPGSQGEPPAEYKDRANELARAVGGSDEKDENIAAVSEAASAASIKDLTKLGADHPDTLTSMANLALTYSNQGRWDEAERLEVEVMEMRKTKLGADHPDTLTSMANVLSRQGKYAEAEQMHRQTLQLWEKVLGQEHPNTLGSMNALALTYYGQARYEESEKLLGQALQGYQKVLGAKHPHTLECMYHLALVLQEQGNYSQAETMHWQVLTSREEVLGLEHPHTILSRNAYQACLIRNKDGNTTSETVIDQGSESK